MVHSLSRAFMLVLTGDCLACVNSIAERHLGLLSEII